jgi:DNA-binding NtrC family response regulator
MEVLMAQPSWETLGTILLVEDHSALLKLVKQILEDANFLVIPAKNAKEAIQMEAEFSGTIDLLLSDVRMRGTSGPNLAKRLKERRPDLRVVLMSGYPGGASLVHHYDWHYIQKPFRPLALVDKINGALRGESRSALSQMAAGSASIGRAEARPGEGGIKPGATGTGSGRRATLRAVHRSMSGG